MAGISQEQAAVEVEGSIAKESTSEEIYEDGCFLPLAVWAVKGLISLLIETKSQDVDTRNHPARGLTYILHILGSKHTRLRELTKTSQVKTEGKRRRLAIDGRSAVAAVDDSKEAAPLVIEDGFVKSSSDGSDTASSNSGCRIKLVFVVERHQK